MLPCIKVWNIWEKLGCVGIKKALLPIFWACIVRKNCFLGNFACTKKIFNRDICDYQCLQCASILQVSSTPFSEKTNSFLLTSIYGIFIFEETQMSIQGNTGIAFWSGSFRLAQKCVYVQTWKTNGESCYKYLHCKTSCHRLTIFLRIKNQQLCSSVMREHFVLSQNWIVTTKTKNNLLLWKNDSAVCNQFIPNPCHKRQNHSHYGILEPISIWLKQLTKKFSPVSFHTISAKKKAVWFFQSLARVLSGLSTSVQI